MSTDSAVAVGHPRTSVLLSDAENDEPKVRRWRVDVVAGPDRGKQLLVDSPTITIGSDEESAFVLSDPAVSRKHVRLELLATGVRVIDLGSKNGTRVGGARVERALVTPGSIVRIGRTEL